MPRFHPSPGEQGSSDLELIDRYGGYTRDSDSESDHSATTILRHSMATADIAYNRQRETSCAIAPWEATQWRSVPNSTAVFGTQ